MTIIRRVHHDGHFVTIDNRTIRDERLSFRARGLLAFALSLPADATLRSEDLATNATEGRDAVRNAMRELEAHGYLVRGRERIAGGRRFRAVSTIYERPEDNPNQEGQGALALVGSRDGFSGPRNQPPGNLAPSPGSPKTRRRGRAKTGTSLAPPRRDLLWDVFDEELGPVTNEAERRRRNAALKPIRQSLGLKRAADATAEHAGQLRRRIRAADEQYDGFTEHAIANNWVALGRARRRRPASKAGGGADTAIKRMGYRR